MEDVRHRPAAADRLLAKLEAADGDIGKLDLDAEELAELQRQLPRRQNRHDRRAAASRARRLRRVH